MIATLQPITGSRLSDHPITRGLVMAVNFAAQSFDSGASSATALVPEDAGIAGPGSWLRGNVSYATGVNRYGNWVGFNNPNVNSHLDWARSDFVPSGGGATVAFVYEKADGVSRAALAWGIDYGLSSSTNGFHAAVPFSDSIVYFQTSSTALGVAGLTFGADVWVFTTGQVPSRGREIWQNGIKRGSDTTTLSRTFTPTMPFKLGATIVGSGITCDIAHFNMFAMWDRQLTTEEIIAVSWSPFMLWDEGTAFDLSPTSPAVFNPNYGVGFPIFKLQPARWG